MKTCVLCENSTLSPKHKLCTKCYREHGAFIHSDWFEELVVLQRRQDIIDSKESYFLAPTSQSFVTGSADIPIVSSSKNIGRPPTDWRLVNEVLRLYDESVDLEKQGVGKRLSLRGIEKKMNHRIKYLTVRKILMIYRNKLR